MSARHRTIVFIGFIVLFFFIGVVVGKIVYNFPLIEWEPGVNFVAVLSWLTTIGIALAIPFLVKKGIDDNRGIKSFLVDEVKELIEITKSIKEVVSSSYSSGTFQPSDKDTILTNFHSAQQKLGSIQDQLKISFESESKKTIEDMKSALSNYKQYLTGGEMMWSSFTSVSHSFNNENNSEYSKMETILKASIHHIHKF